MHGMCVGAVSNSLHVEVQDDVVYRLQVVGG